MSVDFEMRGEAQAAGYLWRGRGVAASGYSGVQADTRSRVPVAGTGRHGPRYREVRRRGDKATGVGRKVSHKGEGRM